MDILAPSALGRRFFHESIGAMHILMTGAIVRAHIEDELAAT